MKATSVSPKLCAGIAVGVGTMTLVGWTLGIAAMVRWQPGWTPMVVNTGVGFVLAGLGLWVAAADRRGSPIISAALGVLVVMLAVEELVVLFFDLSPALSLPELHQPLQPEYPHPGRMAPNTALGLLLFGAGLVALARAPVQWAVGWARAAAVAVASIGLFGVLGYALQLEYLYAWTGVVRMAAHTGLGMIVLGIGLGSLARGRDTAASIAIDQEVAAVFRTSAFLLLVTASAAGIAGFAFLQSQLERQQQEALLQVTRDRIALFELEIDNRSARAAVAATIFDPVEVVALHRGPIAGVELAVLRGRADALRAEGFSYVAVADAARDIVLAGRAAHPELVTTIAGMQPAQLLWDHGFVLRRMLPMVDGADGRVELVTEQPLDALSRVHADTNRWGETAEMAVCGGDRTTLHCFPLRSRARPFNASRIVAGQRLPMDRALHGATGTVVALDYRQHRVLAGYGPIGHTGLGLVVKRDIAEIYAPIRRRFQRILVFLVLLVGSGLWVMRRQLAPLLAALQDSRSQARAALGRLEAAMESNLDAYYVLDCMRDGDGAIVDMRYSMMNAAAERGLARQRGEVIGVGMCALMPVLGSDGLLAACMSVVTTGEPVVLERASVVRPMHWYQMQLVKLGDGVGMTVRDITSARQALEVIRHQSLHDPLTGVVNRAGFEAALNGALSEAHKSGELVALALLDVDRFKDVNDRLGHAAGDQLLIATAARLKACVRPMDVVARLGGDEFVVVLRHVNVDGVEVVARKLVAQLAEPTVLDGVAVDVTVSLGISVYPTDGTEPDQLLRAADHAMYEAKRGGRNRHAFATPAPGRSQES